MKKLTIVFLLFSQTALGWRNLKGTVSSIVSWENTDVVLFQIADRFCWVDAAQDPTLYSLTLTAKTLGVGVTASCYDGPDKISGYSARKLHRLVFMQ